MLFGPILCNLGRFYVIWANLEKIMKFGENCDRSGVVKFDENFQIFQSYEIWSFFSFFSVRQPRRRSQSKGCRELGRPAEISCTAPELCLEVLTPRPGLLPHLPVQGAKYAQYCLIKTQLCHLGLFYIIWANLE